MSRSGAVLPSYATLFTADDKDARHIDELDRYVEAVRDFEMYDA